jgi:hypothetical protein
LTYSSNIDHGGLSIPAASLEMFNELDLALDTSIVVLQD